jgi:16S rRNA (adenine1518-N6/adenine1519-N6)-dimethyltransferase
VALTSPSELLAFLDQLGVRPKKGLSQNFLIDANALAKIIQTARLCPGDHLLEIGPGPGALTEALLKHPVSLIAIEKDPIFANALSRFPSVHVHQGDFLKIDLAPLLAFPTKIVANIPYSITTLILERLIDHHPQILSATLLVQKEFADRILAEKGRDVGSISHFIRYYAIPSLGGIVKRSCFFPAPRVDSAILHLTFRPPPPLPPQFFFPPIRAAFQQRRKTLGRTLRSFPGLQLGLEELGFSLRTRPEELTFNDWLSLLSKRTK